MKGSNMSKKSFIALAEYADRLIVAGLRKMFVCSLNNKVVALEGDFSHVKHSINRVNLAVIGFVRFNNKPYKIIGKKIRKLHKSGKIERIAARPLLICIKCKSIQLENKYREPAGRGIYTCCGTRMVYKREKTYKNLREIITEKRKMLLALQS
jgi:hypothetical protein